VNRLGHALLDESILRGRDGRGFWSQDGQATLLQGKLGWQMTNDFAVGMDAQVGWPLHTQAVAALQVNLGVLEVFAAGQGGEESHDVHAAQVAGDYYVQKPVVHTGVRSHLQTTCITGSVADSYHQCFSLPLAGLPDEREGSVAVADQFIEYTSHVHGRTGKADTDAVDQRGHLGVEADPGHIDERPAIHPRHVHEADFCSQKRAQSLAGVGGQPQPAGEVVTRTQR